MKRYYVLPIALYRFQTGMRPKLREKSAQLSKGLSSYDFTLGPNNLYDPIEGDIF